MKKRVIVYHDNLFGKSIGSTEKLLHDFIRILSSSDSFDIFVVYSKSNGEIVPSDLFPSGNRSFLLFTHSKREDALPFRCLDMKPDLSSILSTVNPDLFICAVWANGQFPIIDIPKRIPLFLISPFGTFSSNGNIRKLYVSGFTGKSGLRKSGIRFAEVFFNPLLVPPMNYKKCMPKSKDKQIVFGRCGRPDPNIFDPISLLAFSKLEKEYRDNVKYVYVNPSDKARDLAGELKLRQVEFRDWLSEAELRTFYQEIDVFAHARADGETLGVAIAEAMLAQNPVISHLSHHHNDHIFLAREPFGKVAGIDNWQQYYEFMKSFVEHREQIPDMGKRAREFAIPYFDKNIISQKILKDVSEAASYYGKPRAFFNTHCRINRLCDKYLISGKEEKTFWKDCL